MQQPSVALGAAVHIFCFCCFDEEKREMKYHQNAFLFHMLDAWSERKVERRETEPTVRGPGSEKKLEFVAKQF